MNECIEVLNRWSETFSAFAWTMLWQSSLLIGVIFVVDLMFARRVRASVRYALWMVVLVKLLLPPALALPTGATWWLWRPHPVVELAPAIQNYTVSFSDSLPEASFQPATVPVAEPHPELSGDAWLLLSVAAMGAGLLSWLAFRWLRAAARVHRAATAPAELNGILEEARQLARLRRPLRLKLIDDRQSPAVYGLFRPVILLPRALANQLSGRQLRAVLLHEAMHLRRGDVWVNFAQTLLQIVYWWHPLLWLANARIRRVREEAVDDAVMLALREGSDAYAPTLLEVARFAFRRPLASLGLIGILESRSALRQRVERLVDFQPSGRTGLTILSLFGIFAFSAVALPMGQGPERPPSTRSSGPVGSSSVNATGVPANITVTRETVSAGHTNTNSKSTLSLAGLDFIQLNEFGPFQHATLSAVIDKLTVKDPNKIPFLIASGLVGGSQTRIDLPKLTNVALSDVLDAIVRGANQPIKYYCMDRFIVFSPVPEPDNLNYELFNPFNGTKVFVSLDTASNAVLFTSVRRDAIYHKMNQNYSAVSFHDLPLSEVLRELRELSLKLDPDKQGINFLFNPRIEQVSSAGTPIDPKTGLPKKAGAVPEIADPTQININLSLKNVSLRDVLNAICLNSDQPIKYTVEDYGIVFSAKGPNSPQYEMRTFKINSTFISKLESSSYEISPRSIPKPRSAVSHDGSSGGARDIGKMAEQFITQLGVDLDPPKTVYYNEGHGVLFVYATPLDLDLIQKAIQVMSAEPPIIHIKARFFEVPKGFFSSAAAKSLPPGMTNGVGRLTTTESKKVLHILEQKGFEELAEPEITTFSGRQARILIGPPAHSNDSLQVPYLHPDLNSDQAAPGLEVDPMALSDGYTVHLSVTATCVDDFGLVDVTPTKDPIVVPTMVAAIQLTSASLHRAVFDGQTLVLFPAQVQPLSVSGMDEKARERVAQYIRQARKKQGDKVLVVLCTVTLTDASGKRVHSDKEVPFAQTSFPPESSADFLPTVTGYAEHIVGD